LDNGLSLVTDLILRDVFYWNRKWMILLMII
jgi:hypothetical protein